MEKEIERSLMFPALHPVNLKQVKGAIKTPGFAADGIWLHGCGNFYTSKKESDDRATFHNDHPQNKGAKYRLHLKTIEDVPSTLKDLEDKLLKSQQKEEQEKSMEVMRKSTNDKSFDFVDEEEESAVEKVSKKLKKEKATIPPPVDPTEPVV